MGKTALACKVLRDLEHQRWSYTEHDVVIDGIVYLSTRTAGISLERLFLDCTKLLEDEERERLRTVWTNPQLKTADKINRLLETLRQGRYVILLDNLEDLLDDRGRFTDEDLRLFFEQDLLRASGTQLVVTSRIPLTLRREIMRFDQKVELLEGLPVEEGVALLRELDPNGEYGLREAPEANLREAVKLTHGVPRALEVLVGILANDPFATLDEVLETFYTHEAVVQALIEEHYKRLDREARRVVEALAVFRKPVPPLAVDFLLEPFEPGLDVPSIIQRLIWANIVTVDRANKTVMLHPIDQDYAYGQLPEEDETAADYNRPALERRAAEYYVQLRIPKEAWNSIEDLEPQLNEFEHRTNSGDYEEAFRVLNTIGYDYLLLWGHYSRLIMMRKEILEYLGNSELRVINLNRLGLTYQGMGQMEQAIEYYKESISLAHKIENQREEAIGLTCISGAYRSLGRVKKAIELNQRSLAIARQIDDRVIEENALGFSGLLYQLKGQFRQSVFCLEEAVKISRRIGDRIEEGRHLGYLGQAFHALGQTQKALKLYDKALYISKEVKDVRREGIQLGRIGHTCYKLGQFERAISLYKRGLSIAQSIHDRRWESHQLIGLAKTFLSKDELALAKQYCTSAIRLDVIETDYQATFTLAVIFLHQHDLMARETFETTNAKCNEWISRTTDLYEPHYMLAAGMIGETVCKQRWSEEGEQPHFLIPAMEKYKRALEITAAPGIVKDAIRDLELIQAAGVEGLEPVFDLLESAKYEPDIPEDLPDLDDLIG
jgi:tetratricopeptide (TPR) repeat protein